MPDRFVAAPRDALRIVPLDRLTAIYHRQSGITHLVEAPVPELIEALAEPRSIDELLEFLAATYDVADADRGALAERVAELAAVGLVLRA